MSEVGSLQEGIVGANSGKNSQNQAKAQDQNGLNSENWTNIGKTPVGDVSSFHNTEWQFKVNATTEILEM